MLDQAVNSGMYLAGTRLGLGYAERSVGFGLRFQPVDATLCGKTIVWSIWV